jgi:hypothetical protein
MKGTPAGPREYLGRRFATVSYDTEADDIAALFQAKLAGLRRRLPKREIPAAVRALREQKDMALHALRERRAAEQASELAQRETKPPTP